jgi:hypothetical protein
LGKGAEEEEEGEDFKGQTSELTSASLAYPKADLRWFP